MKNKFLELIRSKLGCGYVYGSQGEIMTKELLNTLVQRFGRSNYYFNGYSAEKWVGKQCYDCSGLIVWALQQLELTEKDYTAEGLYAMCDKVSQPQPGDLCFNGNLTHVGIYVGSGLYLHAKGTKYGVVITDQYTFVKFGRLRMLQPKQEKPHWAEDPHSYLSQRIVIHEKRFDDKISRGETFALLAQQQAQIEELERIIKSIEKTPG